MKKEKILIFGATGMAGHVVYHYLQSLNRYEITNVAYRNKLTDDSIILDINDKNAVETILIEQKPDIVINCIGILIKGSQKSPDNAIYVNAYFPHHMERFSNQMNFKLIHISTDCVFSGQKGDYSETDFCDADDIYGRSKALGEIINNRDVTIRTSIIGPELKIDGEGLFNWFMQQKGEIDGYTNAYWGGVTTLELAKAIDYILQNPISGLVHLTNGTKISKYDLLSICKEIFGRTDITIVPNSDKHVDKSLHKSNRIDYSVPGFHEMIKEMQEWMEQHKSLYMKIY